MQNKISSNFAVVNRHQWLLLRTCRMYRAHPNGDRLLNTNFSRLFLWLLRQSSHRESSRELWWTRTRSPQMNVIFKWKSDTLITGIEPHRRHAKPVRQTGWETLPPQIGQRRQETPKTESLCTQKPSPQCHQGNANKGYKCRWSKLGGVKKKKKSLCAPSSSYLVRHSKCTSKLLREFPGNSNEV